MEPHKRLVRGHIKGVYFDNTNNTLRLFLDRGDEVVIKASPDIRAGADPRTPVRLEVKYVGK